MSQKLSFFSLVMLIVASIDSVRNLSMAALFGSSLVFFFLAAALMFLVPTALISAELTAAYPEKGGVYHWVHQAFGEKWAMVAIWMQWINTVVWYPTLLSFIAGTAAYLIHPSLVENKIYLVCCILGIFWSLTLVNFLGIHISSAINTICGLLGTVFPMLLLIALGGMWVFSGKSLQISLEPSSWIPDFSHTTSFASLIAIMASFLGMELAGVHVNDIKNPQRNFPRAILLASFFILLSMVLGSLSIACIMPSDQINLVSGVMQVFSAIFSFYHLEALVPVITLCVVIGSVGGIINWLISPAKGLLHAAEFGFLPVRFAKRNSRGVPVNVLLAQAMLVSFFCLVFLFVPGVNGFYWFLTAVSTELYMVMYVLMFLAALRLRFTHKKREGIFMIPGGNKMMGLVCVIGTLGCLLTIVVSFFPPDTISIGSTSRYMWMIGSANILSILPLIFFYRQKKQRLSQ